MDQIPFKISSPPIPRYFRMSVNGTSLEGRLTPVKAVVEWIAPNVHRLLASSPDTAIIVSICLHKDDRG